MRWAAALACLMLGGCHWLFQLNDLHAPPDASLIDAQPIDTYNVDAAPGCWSAAYTGNEDGDAWLDGCDNCPLIMTDNQQDDDGDGIGNACDPNPGMALERIAYFHPMSAWRNVEWVVRGDNPNWQDNSTGIKQANNGNTGPVRTYARVADRTFDQPTVQVIVNFVTPDDDAGVFGTYEDSAVAVYLITGNDSTSGIPAGVRCGIEFPLASNITTTNAFIEKQGAVSNTSSTETLISPLPALITLATLLPGALPGDDVIPNCAVRPLSGVATVPSINAITKPAQAMIGVWTLNASATFTAMFITERKP